MAILVVEDSDVTRRVLLGQLKSSGFPDSVEAESGEAALALLGIDPSQRRTRSASPGSGIDLVLLDIVLPDMDGIEVCRRIRSVVELADLPILMVTAVGQDEQLEAAFEAGAWDYITKPTSQVVLGARIRQALRLKNETEERKAREESLVVAQRRLEDVNSALSMQAASDALTGIANRRKADDHLVREYRRSARERVPISIVMADIDYFKQYNDHFGHPAGDECLRSVAGVLSAHVFRAPDLVARYGGEEFMVILPNTDETGSRHIAERLRHGVLSLRIVHPKNLAGSYISISVGVTTETPEPNGDPTSLIEACDRALYSAKAGGRNCVRHSADEDTWISLDLSSDPNP